MMQNKLDILKIFLTRLENKETEYKWNHMTVCNCGHLLQTLGYKEQEIRDITQNSNFDNNPQIENKYNKIQRKLDKDAGYFILFSLYYEQDIQCELTNLPFSKVVNELISYGFTLDELRDLEFLADKRFADESIIYSNRESLVNYLKNWIKYEELIQNNKNTQTLRQQVKV